MTDKTLNSLQAAKLAASYHDAMNMVNLPDHPYHPTTTPRKVLETYLHFSKVTGATLHNEAWEARAEQVVEELNQKRRAAWAKALKGAA